MIDRGSSGSHELTYNSIGNVIFGQTALNYEEGKHVLKDNVRLFQPSTNLINCQDVGLAAFVKNANKPELYKYGAFASGCAVRTDAGEILDRIGVNESHSSVNRERC